MMRSTIQERIEVKWSGWQFVEIRGDNECWPWLGATLDSGYGYTIFQGKRQVSHRVVYTLMVGPIPEGLQLDHLCRNRWCQNPWHVEPVTAKVNIQRGLSGYATGAQYRARTHCPQGHPYDEVNTIHLKGNRRWCKQCKLAEQRRRRERQKWLYSL